MFSMIWSWLKKLMGRNLDARSPGEPAAGMAKRYSKMGAVNFTAMAANKIANVAVSDCSISVSGDSERAEFLDGEMQRVVSKLKFIATRTLGVGGVILKPWLYGKSIRVDVLNQERAVVLDRVGDCIKRIAFIADAVEHDGNELVRVEIHELDGEIYTIEQRALRNGREVGLDCVAAWANLPEKQVLEGVDSMLFAWIRCPIDDRGDGNNLYGVPLTYGCEALMDEIQMQLDILQNEVVDKRAFIGADFRLFRSDERGRERLLPGSNIFKKFDAAGGIDDKPFFEVFSPDMRVGQICESVNFKLALLEKAIGVNRGVLTDLVVGDATATAIKRSTYDTFALVDAFRVELADGLKQLLYAMGVLADLCDLAENSKPPLPAGEPPFQKGAVAELVFDWSYGLIEDNAETFAQLAQGVALGAVNVEELREWLGIG